MIVASEGNCRIKARVRDQFVNAAGFCNYSLAFSSMNAPSAYALALTESMGVTVNANVSCVKAVSAGDGLLACVTIFDRSNRMVALRSEALVKKVVTAHGFFCFNC